MICLNIRVILEYKGTKYIGDFQTAKEEDVANLKSLVEHVAKGECNYFKMIIKANLVYFPEAILKKSIITIEESKFGE